nr:integrase, catalytic region, zinc finger, CCHC-type, peptidase aspartic, catalytic [Tanacetum cinerariifolium]GEV35038.1 integrase, catalytic region, zinc finger, CCHC-type, peptidase aspartic, catalytic [Tanacetum cinerariifolium]
MEDHDMTMKEYVQYETEKALKNSNVYNWKTVTYGKIRYVKDVNYLGFFETKFPAIIDDALISELEFSYEPMERIRMLMHDSEKTKRQRHSRLVDEFDKFVMVEGESLSFVYKRLTTLVNVMEQNKIRPLSISINIKFLNSLQPEWSKYVTMTRQNANIKETNFDNLFDSPSQYEPHVIASRAKKDVRNHYPLALVAHSNVHSLHSHTSPSYSHSPQPYYVTHPSSVIDYKENYQGEIQEDAQKDKLTIAMMLLARTITQRRSNRNQIATVGNRMVQQNEANDPIIQEQMLLAMKDEAGGTLNKEENDFMLDNHYGDDSLEELNAAVIMMARIQPANNNDDVEPKHDNHAKLKIVMNTSDDDQIDYSIIFDDPYVDNNCGIDEHDSNAHGQFVSLESLIYNVKKEAKNEPKPVYATPLNKNKDLKAKIVSKVEIKADKSKPVTSCSTSKKEQNQKPNANVIARGMYRVTKTETKTSVAKTNKFSCNSTRVAKSSSVSRVGSKDTNSKKRVLLNTKSKSTSKDTVNVVHDSLNLVCVSRGKDVFLTSHDNCVARYALSSNSRVKRASFPSTATAKSSKVIQIVLWIVDNGCSKHMTGNMKLLRNFVKKSMGTVCFGNDNFAEITRFGDYVQVFLNRFAKLMKDNFEMSMTGEMKLFLRLQDSRFELIAYSDADHARCHNDCKTTFGGLQFLEDKLVSWSFKNQDCTVMSTAKEKTEYQLADLFTKALPIERFEYLVHRIGMRCMTPTQLEHLAKLPSWKGKIIHQNLCKYIQKQN